MQRDAVKSFLSLALYTLRSLGVRGVLIGGSMGRLQVPSHTQFPNLIIDKYMASMTLAEIKCIIAITRKTIGWHKISDRISYSQLQEITGLSVNAIKAGIAGLRKRKLITAEKTNMGYRYDINFEETSTNDSTNDTTVSTIDREGCQPLIEGVSTIDTTKETIKRKVKKTNTCTGDWEEVKDFYKERMKSLMGGQEPFINWKFFTKIVNPVFKEWGKDKTIEALEGFFRDPWVKEHDYTLSVFKNEPNKYLNISKYDPKVGLGVEEYLEREAQKVDKMRAQPSIGAPEFLNDKV